MPRKKNAQIQPNLFSEQLTSVEEDARHTATTAFELFSAELPKWHKFQEVGNNGKRTGGNDYFWWRSRYSDWLGDAIPETECRHKFDKVFKEVWIYFEPKLTRNAFTLGLPEKA